MTVWLRRVGFVALVLGLAVWTHAGLLRSGPEPEDWRWLAGLQRIELPAASAAELPRVHAPLANALCGAIGSLAGADDERAWTLLRATQLALLVATAFAAGAAARAALVPWLGAEGAAAAGRAVALLIPVHPLVGASIARIEGLGELVSCLLGALACGLFLRARHQRDALRLGLAFALLVPAALAGRPAALAVLWLALVELTSSQRHRPLARSLRTALTTLVAGALVVGGTWLAWGLPGVQSAESAAASGWPGLARLLYVGVEKAGVLLVPGAPQGASGARLVALGVLLLCAAHPAFVAARSAPRLWGWIACTLLATWLAALLVHPRVRVAPGEFAAAQVLLPAQIVVAVVLAVAATALAGTRRWLLPLFLALAWALTGRLVEREASPLANALAGWRASAQTAASELGPAHELWWIAGTRSESDELARSVPALLHPGLARAGGERRALAQRTLVRTADAEAAAYVLRSQGSAELRAAGLVLLLPAALLDPAAREGAAPIALRVAPLGEAPTTRAWRGEGRSPELDCEPASIGAVRVVAQAGTATGEAPRLAWRAREPRCESGATTGVWVEGAPAPQAWFELDRDLAWLAGRRIARVWCEGELVRLASAELLPELPAGASAPEPERGAGDWRCRLPAQPWPRPVRGEGRWSLVLIDAERLRSLRCALAPAPDGAQLAPGSQDFARAAREHGTRALTWSLEYGVGAVTLMRSSGSCAP